MADRPADTRPPDRPETTADVLDVPGVLCGAAWAGTGSIPYPRADPTNFDRLPIDTWATASVPAAVRLELELDPAVTAISIDYTATTDELGYRGAGAGVTFALWDADGSLASKPAELGHHTVQLDVPQRSGESGTPHRRVTVYIPEGMKPHLDAVRSIGGQARPPAPRPRWLCYGDSIAEGWSASEPARSWPATVARRHDLDVVNLGYAGSARGEIVSAEHISSLEADVISLAHGTNCWSRTPHSTAQIRANLDAFLDLVRVGHPQTPIVIVSPVVRADAEATPNVLGATLADIRATMEDVVKARQSDDTNLHLVPGGAIIPADDLVDGVHPGDDGHATMAAAIGPAIARAAAGER